MTSQIWRCFCSIDGSFGAFRRRFACCKTLNSTTSNEKQHQKYNTSNTTRIRFQIVTESRKYTLTSLLRLTSRIYVEPCCEGDESQKIIRRVCLNSGSKQILFWIRYEAKTGRLGSWSKLETEFQFEPYSFHNTSRLWGLSNSGETRGVRAKLDHVDLDFGWRKKIKCGLSSLANESIKRWLRKWSLLRKSGAAIRAVEDLFEGDNGLSSVGERMIEEEMAVVEIVRGEIWKVREKPTRDEIASRMWG